MTNRSDMSLRPLRAVHDIHRSMEATLDHKRKDRTFHSFCFLQDLRDIPRAFGEGRENHRRQFAEKAGNHCRRFHGAPGDSHPGGAPRGDRRTHR